jgi:hypothetical protein
MRTYQAATMTDLHTKMILSLVEAPAEELDVISNVDVQIHDVIGVADSMDWEFDLKTLWLTPQRWSMMVNQYLDADALQAWLDQCTSKIGVKGRGIALMRTKIVKPRGGAATGHSNKETRRWGSCMISLSYKALPRPTIHLHSRTSYLGYIGALDLSVAWMAGKYLAHELGIDVKDIAFVWTNEAIQWHNFKSMAWMLCNPDPWARKKYRRLLTAGATKLTDDEFNEIQNTPALKMTRQWLMKVRKEDAQGLTYGDMTYNTYRRIRRRWHTEVFGFEHAKRFEGWSYYQKGEKAGEQKDFFKAYNPLPSTPIENLDFRVLKMPFGQQYGGDYVPGLDEDDEDGDDE